MKKRLSIGIIICAAFICLLQLTAAAHGEMKTVYDLTDDIHRYKVLPSDTADYYVSRGWSWEPAEYDARTVTVMYSDDGRIMYCPTEYSEAQSTVGWYYSPRHTMYSADGRTNTVNIEDIEANENVGWYIEPTARMRGADGDKYIIKSEMEDYRQNGWLVREYSEGLDALKTQINDYVKNQKGNWGVYVKNLNTGDYLLINDDRYSSASIIKLFVMASAYNEISYGSVIKDWRVSRLLNDMITDSDNYSANQLVRIIGGGSYERGFNAENAHSQSVGCINTQHKSLFIGYGDYVSYGRNLVSPLDCGILLEKIYRRELVTPEYSDEMLTLLKNQHRTWKIPQPLPEGVVTANKTGENASVESDVAIVYSPACDYIICVLTNYASSGVYGIRDISKMTYNYFNS